MKTRTIRFSWSEVLEALVDAATVPDGRYDVSATAEVDDEGDIVAIELQMKPKPKAPPS